MDESTIQFNRWCVVVYVSSIVRRETNINPSRRIGWLFLSLFRYVQFGSNRFEDRFGLVAHKHTYRSNDTKACTTTSYRTFLFHHPIPHLCGRNQWYTPCYSVLFASVYIIIELQLFLTQNIVFIFQFSQQNPTTQNK